MGTSNGAKSLKEDDEFTVITSELYKSSNSEIYIIKKLSEVRHKKLKGLYLLNQCTSNDSQKLFFESETLPENSIIYYFSSSSKIPTLKTYSEIEAFQPFNDPQFYKIIILSTNSSTNDNISNLEISKYIQDKGGFKYDMVLDFTKSEENLSQMEKNAIKNNMIISISSLGFEEQKLNPDNKSEIFKITGNINNNSILYVIKWLFNDKMPKEGNDNSDIINNQIKHIMIKNSIIDDINSFNKLVNILNCFPIQLFTFCENSISNDIKWWEQISKILKNNYSIKYIDFHSQNINDEIIPVLVKPLSDKNIKIIDLGGNNLTSKGCEIISENLKIVNSSQKLYFRNNHKILFKSDGVKFITEGLINNENIEFLEFSNMDITGCGIYLKEIIKNKSNFKYLFVKNCKLNCKDFKYIFEEIEQSESIKEVDVSDNNMGGDKALQYIAGAIKNNKSLTYLGMENLNINMDNYEIIFDAIKFNIDISSYTLSYNSGLKPKIVLSFFLGLTHVKYLEYIPYGPQDKGKELTLEEKKLIEQFKNERKDLELIYKENNK
jgi:hypothetical protein